MSSGWYWSLVADLVLISLHPLLSLLLSISIISLCLSLCHGTVLGFEGKGRVMVDVEAARVGNGPRAVKGVVTYTELSPGSFVSFNGCGKRPWRASIRRERRRKRQVVPVEIRVARKTRGFGGCSSISLPSTVLAKFFSMPLLVLLLLLLLVLLFLALLLLALLLVLGTNVLPMILAQFSSMFFSR